MAIGVAVAMAWERPQQFYKISFQAITAILGVGVLFFLIIILPQKDIIFPKVVEGIRLMFEESLNTQKEAGLELETFLQIKSIQEEYVHQAFVLMPFGYIFWVTLLFAMNSFVIKRFFILNLPRLYNVKINEYRLPFEAVWAFIIFLAMWLVNEYKIHSGLLQFLSMNVLMVLCLLFLLQGLAVFWSFLNYKKIYGFLRLFIYLTCFLFFQPTIFFFLGVGLFDPWVDIRKRMQEPKKTNPPV